METFAKALVWLSMLWFWQWRWGIFGSMICLSCILDSQGCLKRLPWSENCTQRLSERRVRVTYTGRRRGLQLGSPSLPSAVRSQRHQFSMTSPFPAHQYELIVALLKACKINGTGERNAIISMSKRPSGAVDESPRVANNTLWKVACLCEVTQAEGISGRFVQTRTCQDLIGNCTKKGQPMCECQETPSQGQ